MERSTKVKFPLVVIVTLSLVVVAAMVLYFSGKLAGIFASALSVTTEVQSAAQPQNIFEVSYIDQGFEPAFFKVQLGTTVRFTNNSSLPLWTASDPHPLHSDFSIFDSGRSLGRGEQYSFTFTKEGSFGFHNHVKSLHRGVVKVIGRGGEAPNIDKTKEGQRAVRDELMGLLDQGDPASVTAVITRIEKNGALARDCHDMAHDLGHRAYELFGFSTAMTFDNPDKLSNTSVDDICAGGYMHGILEELFLHQPELQNAPGTVCASVPELNRDSCLHGVGHGLMFVTKRDVPASLAQCRKVDERSYVAARCYEGVWMEMFWGTTDHAGVNSLGWSIDQPLEPCRNAETDQKPACFLYAHLGYLRTHPGDFSGTIALCTHKSLSASDSGFCLRGVGITMMKHVTSRHLERSEQLVSSLSEQQKKWYYEGVVGYARLSGVSEKAVSAFCSQLVTDSSICANVQATVPR